MPIIELSQDLRVNLWMKALSELKVRWRLCIIEMFISNEDKSPKPVFLTNEVKWLSLSSLI